MLNALGGCGAAGAASQPPLWLGLVAGGILGLGWLALHQVAAGYPTNRKPG
jgi:hypothetical protein